MKTLLLIFNKGPNIRGLPAYHSFSMLARTTGSLAPMDGFHSSATPALRVVLELATGEGEGEGEGVEEGEGFGSSALLAAADINRA